MAFSTLGYVRNGLIYPRIVRNIHFSPGLKQVDTLKKGPSETEKRVMMGLKFAVIFIPSVYLGAYIERKGFLKKQKVIDKDPGSGILEKVEEIFKKIEEKVKEVKDGKKKNNMAFERRLPLLRTDFSVIDREFSSIREKFDQEMKLMEEEMNRFRTQLMDREMPKIQSHTASVAADGQTTHRSEVRTWLDGLSSPLIQDADDGKKLRLRFDVSQYQPEEIVVKTVDNKLQVQAKHEEKSDTKSVYREYNREFLLPKGTNPEMIKSSLSTDGVLTVEAPLPALEGIHMIPIENK